MSEKSKYFGICKTCENMGNVFCKLKNEYICTKGQLKKPKKETSKQRNN